MSANMAEGAYTIHTSSSDSEPDWPDLQLSELIKLGFGEERVIRDMNQCREPWSPRIVAASPDLIRVKSHEPAVLRSASDRVRAA